MTTSYPPLQVRVRGPAACFTRPEMKVERVTYPVMTPSAARGVLEAILWKPQFRWRIEEIRVLEPIEYFSILRNEVNTRQSDRTARGWANAGGIGGFDAAADRAQRHTLALRKVDYIVQAQVEVAPSSGDSPAKYRDQFRRRVARGQCFHRPYFGCREFAAEFLEPDGSEEPIDRTEDIGLMLLDIKYDSDGSGRGRPVFFAAQLERGVLHVPRLEETAGSLSQVED